MAAPHGTEIRVGLIVLLGLAAITALVLMSDTVSFERHYRISVYLDDGEGLRQRSPVTFAGLPVGEVVRVEQVADPRGRVLAVAEIKRSRRLPADSVVRRSSSGFFGDAFLAVTGGTDPRAGLLPDDGSAVLVARPGFLAEAGAKATGLLDSVGALLDEPTRRDAQALIARSATLAGEAAALIAELRATQRALGGQAAQLAATAAAIGGQLERSLAAVERVALGLEATVAGMDRRLSALTTSATAALGDIAVAARVAASTAQRVDHLIAEARAPLVGAAGAVAGLAARLDAIAARIADGEGVIGQLLGSRQLAGDLNAMAVDAAALAKLLAETPSRLVFDADERTAAAERAARDRRKQERALSQFLGLGGASASGALSATAPASRP